METLELENNYDSHFKFIHQGDNLLICDTISDYSEIENVIREKENYSNLKVIPYFVKGTYDVYVAEEDSNKFGKRVKEIVLFNELYDYEFNNLENKWEYLFELTIESGSCMFVSDYVLNHKISFDIYLEKWMTGQFQDNIFQYKSFDKVLSFISNSGYGDGVYDFYAYYDGNEIIGIRVSFIDETDGEDTGVPEYSDSETDSIS